MKLSTDYGNTQAKKSRAIRKVLRRKVRQLTKKNSNWHDMLDVYRVLQDYAAFQYGAPMSEVAMDAVERQKKER
jgi:hypothetical protein